MAGAALVGRCRGVPRRVRLCALSRCQPRLHPAVWRALGPPLAAPQQADIESNRSSDARGAVGPRRETLNRGATRCNERAGQSKGRPEHVPVWRVCHS